MDRDLGLEAECLRDELAEFDQAATQQLAAVVDKVARLLQTAKPHWTTSLLR